MVALHASTSERWLEAVLDDFDTFLLDHAACERKASANAVSLVTHYHDRKQLVGAMIELAREELEHFQQVYQIIAKRGLILTADRRDPYVRKLRAQVRTGRAEYFLDRLLIAGIAEARGCERFGLIAGAQENAGLEIASFYRALSRSEARHCDVFVDLARAYYDAPSVSTRLEELLEHESRILCELPIAPALH